MRYRNENKPFRVNHVTWAKGLMTTQGLEGAHRITFKYSQPFLGKDLSEKNLMAGFYSSAFTWLKKNHPVKEDHPDIQFIYPAKPTISDDYR